MRRLWGSLIVCSVVAGACAGANGDPADEATRRTEPATSAPATPAPPAAAPAPAPAVTAAPAPVAPPAPLAPAETKALQMANGVIVPVIAGGPGAWRVGTPCGRDVTVASGGAIGPVEVVLDAGHGGQEPGAVSTEYGITEKALNLDVTKFAADALAREGVAVTMTRTADYRMTLAARGRMVKLLAPRAFVSIHHNAEPDGPWPGPGSETYYQVASADSRRLAGLVYEEVVKALSAYRIGWVADRDAGTKYRRNTAGTDYYAILRLTNGVTSALAELAFISNPAEAALLTQMDVRRVEGEAVARGIVRYLRTQDPGSGFVEPYPRESPAGGGGGSSNCVDPPLPST